MFEWRQRLCRTCGTHIDESSATPLFEGENYPMVIIIENITDMYLDKAHDMPELICQGCKRDLERFLEFRTKFMANNEFLQYKRNALELQAFDSANDLIAAVNIEDESQVAALKVEDKEIYDEPLLEVKTEENTMDNDDVAVKDEGMDNNADEPLLTAINIEDNTMDNEAVESLLSALNIKDKELDENVEYKDMDDYAVEYLVTADEVIQNHGDVSPPLVPPDKGEEGKDVDDDDDDEISNPTPTSTIKKKSRPTKKSDKTWICHICEGEYKCSTYLKLHMMRHSGKKEIECDICHARYYTAPEMRRHRILHTDARPYACRYCNKTFRGCSSKAVHERSHTDERPFACQYCDKSFRSTSARRRHERVHTNTRNYHCELCDLSFLRCSHLTKHKNTKIHKRKMAVAMDD